MLLSNSQCLTMSFCIFFSLFSKSSLPGALASKVHRKVKCFFFFNPGWVYFFLVSLKRLYCSSKKVIDILLSENWVFLDAVYAELAKLKHDEWFTVKMYHSLIIFVAIMAGNPSDWPFFTMMKHRQNPGSSWLMLACRNSFHSSFHLQ